MSTLIYKSPHRAALLLTHVSSDQQNGMIEQLDPGQQMKLLGGCRDPGMDKLADKLCQNLNNSQIFDGYLNATDGKYLRRNYTCFIHRIKSDNNLFFGLVSYLFDGSVALMSVMIHKQNLALAAILSTQLKPEQQHNIFKQLFPDRQLKLLVNLRSNNLGALADKLCGEISYKEKESLIHFNAVLLDKGKLGENCAHEVKDFYSRLGGEAQEKNIG
ncbi:hypothetical protein QT397_17125 [Microbulbifer sp. MKSA007]|nr:hypothetical protein QT397_17125 [Microbulbifer sp. MKSA007]